MKTDIEALINSYQENGYALLLEVINELPEFEALIDQDTEKVYEKDECTLRSIYGFQNNSTFIEWLKSCSLIKEITHTLLGEQVYLHQTKVNLKNQNESSVWPYHRDFPFWKVFDHFPDNQFLNVVVYLDDVFEGSGELKVIPKSHNHFLAREAQDVQIDYSLEGSASSDLLFSFSADELEMFSSSYGIDSTIGRKGSLLIFDPNLIHGSGSSSIDYSRKIMILTFNTCSNIPLEQSKRPNYLCNINRTPITW
jgi:ectoine hydroxylase